MKNEPKIVNKILAHKYRPNEAKTVHERIIKAVPIIIILSPYFIPFCLANSAAPKAPIN